MKLIRFVILFLTLSSAAFAQSTAVISGTFTNLPDASFTLKTSAYQLSLQPATITTGKLDVLGNLQINLNLGGGGVPLTLSIGGYDVNLYITVGDSVYMTADGKKFHETLTFMAKGAEANNFIEALFNRFEKPDMDEAIKMAADKTDPIGGYIKLPHAIKFKTMLQDDFNKFSDKLCADKLKFFKEKSDKNYSKFFQSWMLAEIKYEPATMKTDYPSIHTMLNPVEPNSNYNTKFESVFNPLNLNDSNAIFSDHYIRYLESYFSSKPSSTKKSNVQPTMREKMDEGYYTKKSLLTGSLCDYLLARHIASCQTLLKNDTALNKKLLGDYKEININKSFLNILMQAYAPKQSNPAMNTINAGDKAPSFTVLGADGKSISLSDFKGKVVYMDVWASWCGPCKREIPFAKELEEKMKGKNIVFLGVSIDRDSSSWRRLLNEQHPAGIQAIDLDPGNNISKNYGVPTIPRFIIIDKNGIIVDPNAKRPSGGVEEDLLKLLE